MYIKYIKLSNRVLDLPTAVDEDIVETGRYTSIQMKKLYLTIFFFFHLVTNKTNLNNIIDNIKKLNDFSISLITNSEI